MILVSYWEIPVSEIRGRFQKLKEQGITEVGTFVPWQAFESDISHHLLRFLQAAQEMGMGVALIPAPEVGVHYNRAGIPKDLGSGDATAAKDFRGREIASTLAPNPFRLPAILSEGFQKRYGNYLAKLNGFLADFRRNTNNTRVRILTTGSFWKYYRSARDSSFQPFGGPAGDRSKSAGAAYRAAIEARYSSREFAHPTPSSANRWKARSLDEINRRWFFQYAETEFRRKTTAALKRSGSGMPVEAVECFTPEADPAFQYTEFLSAVTGMRPGVERLSAILDAYAQRCGVQDGEVCAPFVRWTGFGAYRNLAPSEKQFLLLKSLVSFGGQGGGVWIDDGEWERFSPAFRERFMRLVHWIGEGKLVSEPTALVVSPHTWSPGPAIWDELRVTLGAKTWIVPADEVLPVMPSVRLLVADPVVVFTKKQVQELLSWARRGVVVALPRSALYSDEARETLEAALSDLSEPMDLRIGVPYHTGKYGLGRIVLYEMPDSPQAQADGSSPWKRLASALINLSSLTEGCRFSDSRLEARSLRNSVGGTGLFVMNPTNRVVSADVLFPGDVRIHDLSAAMEKGIPVANPRARDAVEPGSRFSLEVPPLGVLPLAIEDAPATVLEPHALGMEGGVQWI